MSILILGGTGFLGSTTALALSKKSFEVKVLCRKRPDKTLFGDSDIGIFTADVASLRADDPIFDGVETVMHFISATTPASSMQDMAFDVSANLLPILNLLEIMKERKIPRLVYASSGGTIYGIPARLPASEDDAATPICAHGITKLTIEKFILLHGRLRNMTPIILRIGNPYGSYQLRGVTIGSIARFIHLHSTGRPVEIWGDGTVVRDYIYIDDFRDALTAIVENQAFPAGTYNLASGAGHTLLDIISEIERVSQRKVRCNFEHKRLIDVPAIILDITRLRRALPSWRPRISLAKGIELLWAAASEALPAEIALETARPLVRATK
jgi:UDP-glucose 4-epimerase